MVNYDVYSVLDDSNRSQSVTGKFVSLFIVGKSKRNRTTTMPKKVPLIKIFAMTIYGQGELFRAESYETACF